MIRSNSVIGLQKPNLALQARAHACIMPAPASAFKTFPSDTPRPCKSLSSATATAPSPGCTNSACAPSRRTPIESGVTSSSTSSAIPNSCERRRDASSFPNSRSSGRSRPRRRTWRDARSCSFTETCSSRTALCRRHPEGKATDPPARRHHPAGGRKAIGSTLRHLRADSGAPLRGRAQADGDDAATGQRPGFRGYGNLVARR